MNPSGQILSSLDSMFSQQDLGLGTSFVECTKIQTQEFHRHSQLIQHQAIELLSTRPQEALDYFDFALELDPLNSDLYEQQALALKEEGEKRKSSSLLLQACKRFRKAYKYDEKNFGCLLSWAETLQSISSLKEKSHYLNEAKKKFEQLLCFESELEANFLSQALFEYAKVMSELLLHSQEVSDGNLTLQIFHRIETSEKQKNSAFWTEYGLVHYRLANQIQDDRLLIKGIECFKQAASYKINDPLNWIHLANSLSKLYFSSQNEDYFSQAQECFHTAATLSNPKEMPWTDWALLLFESGSRLQDQKRLISCIECCQKAKKYGHNHTSVYTIWSQALCALGLLQEKLDHILDAENIVLDRLETETTSELKLTLGMCYYSYGLYYNDLNSFYFAVETFQEGLSLDRSCHKLWFALALAYTQTAEFEKCTQHLELACKFFAKAIHLHTHADYYYEYALTLSKLGQAYDSQHHLELSILNFEQALQLQKNAVYLHPQWLFQFALTLDTLADLVEEASLYQKAIELLTHVLIIEPEHPQVHYRIALVSQHLAELLKEKELFEKSLYHFQLAHKTDQENEELLVDWAVCLMSLLEFQEDSYLKSQLVQEAEYKLIQSAKLGAVEAYYNLACLYSLSHNLEKSIYFLNKALRYNCLPSLCELLTDSWLDNIRNHDSFRELLTQLDSSEVEKPF